VAEKDFQSELNRGLRSANWWVYKIPDSPASKFGGVAGSRFTAAKPFDCVALADGQFHALELKQVSAGLSFPLKGLQDHQEDALLAVEARGGAGWLVVNFRVRLSETQKRKRGVEKLDLAYAARIHQVVSARVDEARTGLPLDWWQQHAVELPRQRSGGVLSWDPTPLAEAVA
jgi:penicillin-binding protein-related factor A (putative recombinase)